MASRCLERLFEAVLLLFILKRPCSKQVPRRPDSVLKSALKITTGLKSILGLVPSYALGNKIG